MANKSQAKSLAPVANPVSSFWNSYERPLDDYRSTPDLPATCDVLIIGAGFAGVGTAFHLLKCNPNPPSIVMLEARKVASGATGRNGGHVKPDMYYSVPKYSEIYGAQAAAEVANFESSHVYAVKNLVETEGLDCDFHLTRAVDVFLNAEHAQATKASFKELKAANLVDLHDVDLVPNKQEAERVSGIKGAQCCFSYTAAHLWPSKMVHQLLGKLVGMGINLQANTPVQSVSPARDAQGLWTVQTARGTVAARQVVYATNAYTAQVLPEYRGRIVPVRGVASHIASPARGAATPHLVNTYGIRFDAVHNDYLIPRADGSVVVGGARQRFWHDRGRWFDSVNDAELIAATASYFDGYMQRLFRGWEDSGAEPQEVWTGILGYSSDFMPHVGEVPDKPGQYIIAGFSGHGMPQILLSSKGLASMIRDGTPFEKSGLPCIFKTSKERITNARSPLEDSLKPLWEGGAKAKL